MTDERPFSASQLAKRWGCSEQHIRNMVKRGEIHCFYIGNLIRIPACEVMKKEGLSFTEDHGMSSGENEAKPKERPFILRIADKPSGASKNF